MIVIKRDLETDFDKTCAPLTWRWAMDKEHRFPIVFDAFGHGMEITKHTIAPDGTVSPSVVCTAMNCTFGEDKAAAARTECNWKGCPFCKPCTFHEFIKLEGYP